MSDHQDPPHEAGQFRHWITGVEVTPGSTDPNCKFSARLFVDEELVCNLPWVDNARPLQWSGLLPCDVSPLSAISLRLCKSVRDRPRYFNFPPFTLSEIDEETGQATLELPEAAWVVIIKFLTPGAVEQIYPDELDRFNGITGVYDPLEPNSTVKYLFKHTLQLANLIAEVGSNEWRPPFKFWLIWALLKAVPESTAKVSFLIYMEVWEVLNQQTQLDETVRAILHSLTRIHDIVAVVGQVSNSILATVMHRSREPINGILALLGDASIYIFNKYNINELARTHLNDDDEPNDAYDLEAHLVRLQSLQDAFYAAWPPATASYPDNSYVVDNEPSTFHEDTRAPSEGVIQADWYGIQNLLRPINPSGYDLDRACQDGTREAVLSRILAWTQNRENSESFMWISGQAGMGKTSIATSLCQRLDSIQALGGSFFCQCDNPSSVDPLALVNNLICDIAMSCPAFAHEVVKAIRASPKLSNSQLSLRYRGLVKAPLEQLQSITVPITLVAVIDGLDECGDRESREKALVKLYEMSQLVPWLKVIFTGRPIGDLQRHFQTDRPHATIFHLQEYDASPDIRAYLEGELGRLADSESWPSDGIDRLCAMAQGVFLWAAVAAKYIKRSTFPSLPRLQKVLNNQKSPVTDYFDALYARALETALDDNETEIKEAYIQCIGSILAISQRASLSIPDLQYLLLVVGGIDQLTLEQIITNLGPLLRTVDGRIRFYHPSFEDFITDSSRSGEFYIQLGQYEAEPTACCLKVMQRELKFNICELETSHLLNNQVPNLNSRIKSHIGPALKYACMHWIDHFIASPNQALAQEVKKFLEEPQLLYWIEVLSLLGHIDSAITELPRLMSLNLFAQFNEGDPIVAAAKDAHRFILTFYDAITASTPHLYVSALAFAPSNSLIIQRMRGMFPNTITIAQGGYTNWHPCVKSIVHPHPIQSFSLSPDGLKLIVGYPNGSLALWSTKTGARLSISLVGHRDSVNCVAFSPDGNLVASGSHDTTIRVWDLSRDLQDSQMLSSHSGSVHSITFSPNGTMVASGASDNVIRLWDTNALHPIGGPYVGHSNRVSCLAFSPDGTKLVSGSWDNTIRVWSVDVGGLQLARDPLVISGHTDSINCISVSPDGTKIASGSVDNTLRIWSVRGDSADEIQITQVTLQQSVTSVAFSSNGSIIVSTSFDGAIHLHNATTLKEAYRPFGHSDTVNGVTFTPDGAYIVSGSIDTTIRVWDIKACAKAMTTAPIVGHTGTILSVSVSNDGAHIISGSWDYTIRIWDAQTGAQIDEPYVGHSGAVYPVFVLDGTRIVSGSQAAPTSRTYATGRSSLRSLSLIVALNWCLVARVEL